MYLEPVKVALEPKYTVKWNEFEENSPICINLKSESKLEIAKDIKSWISALSSIAQQEAQYEADCTRVAIKTGVNNLHASVYHTGTVMIQGNRLTLGSWVSENMINVIKAVDEKSESHMPSPKAHQAPVITVGIDKCSEHKDNLEYYINKKVPKRCTYIVPNVWR